MSKEEYLSVFGITWLLAIIPVILYYGYLAVRLYVYDKTYVRGLDFQELGFGDLDYSEIFSNMLVFSLACGLPAAAWGILHYIFGIIVVLCIIYGMARLARGVVRLNGKVDKLEKG